MERGRNRKNTRRSDVMSLSFLNTRRQKILAFGSTTAGLVAVVAAVAYFTGADGSGTGQASVGASTAWSVSVNTAGASGGPIYPGNGTDKIPFTVTNNGGGAQNLNRITYAINHDASGNITQNGTALPNCLATWFNAGADATNPTLPDDIAHGGTYTGKVDVTMSDPGTNQDPCQNATPDVTVTATSS
jgi:hypothetical protein